MTLKKGFNYHFTREFDSFRGPAAAFIGIKHIGTNGGGFFWVNSAHPLENITNAVELWAQLIIPFAMIFCLGFI
jgi:K+-transporting ATPase ATPase A chain